MIEEPNCSKRKCKHLNGVIENAVTGMPPDGFTCAAFPDGILDAIAYGDNKHLRPLPGQGNDIVYERKEES